MKCCSIKLSNRTEERQLFIEKNGHRCHPAILDIDDYYRHSSSETNADQAMEDDQPSLSVLNIMLPKDTKAFNTGSSIQRWANKRPRLRSAKGQNTINDQSLNADLDNLDVSNLIKELQNECEEEEEEPKVCDNDENEEIHPDIQRLLSATSEILEKTDGTITDSKRISFDLEEKPNADDGVKRKSKRKHKRKSKDGSKHKEKTKSKKKLTKTVSFSISKPPTPQTEQVIRVDVISNFSVEFPVESNRTDAMSSDPSKICTEIANMEPNKSDGGFVFQVFCTEKPEEKKDFLVESKKAVLFPRNGEK